MNSAVCSMGFSASVTTSTGRPGWAPPPAAPPAAPAHRRRSGGHNAGDEERPRIRPSPCARTDVQPDPLRCVSCHNESEPSTGSPVDRWTVGRKPRTTRAVTVSRSGPLRYQPTGRSREALRVHPDIQRRHERARSQSRATALVRRVARLAAIHPIPLLRPAASRSVPFWVSAHRALVGLYRLDRCGPVRRADRRGWRGTGSSDRASSASTSASAASGPFDFGDGDGAIEADDRSRRRSPAAGRRAATICRQSVAGRRRRRRCAPR